jgi:arylsulfatase A-like enzyme/tetratricopeptide (TPR) repeat protein
MPPARTLAFAACVALALAAASCGRPPRGARDTASRAAAKAIVLVTIDTLRADRLGAYGSTRGLTPALDRFGREAVRFSAAVTQVPLTLPAHATILTGRHPAAHGVRTNDGFRLSRDVPTLAEALKARGYATAAFIGGYPLRGSSGLARGFDRYDDDFLRRANAVERPADEVAGAALQWLDAQAGRPAFAWLHFFDPHSPYTPPPPFAAAHVDAPYDGEVAYTDAAAGRFFDALRQRHLWTDTAIVVVADHGEALGEHGERTHGTFLYDATIRVPLMIKPSGTDRARTVDVPVETADIAPTLAAMAGTMMAGIDGRDLTPLIDGAPGDPERPAYAESYYQNVLLGWSPLRAVRTAQWKFVEAPRPELYDLRRDPAERENRIDERAALASGLRRALPPSSADAGPAGTSAGADAAERLRSLGYVSGATVPTAASRSVDPKDRVEVWAHIENGIDRMAADPAAARQSFAAALQLDAANGLAMKYLADLDFRAGRRDAAEAGYRRALGAGFRHPDVFVNLASIAESGGRLEAAAASLAEAIKAAPSDADAWNRLGLLEARRNRLDAARRAFTSAVAADPDRAEAYYNLGVIDRRAGDETAAQAHLQQAVDRNPVYAEAHYELGTGYLLARRPDRALEAYRAALAARPEYPEALFGAARAALDLGRIDDARRDYERFIQIAPAEYRAQADAAREALRRLRPARTRD